MVTEVTVCHLPWDDVHHLHVPELLRLKPPINLCFKATDVSSKTIYNSEQNLAPQARAARHSLCSNILLRLGQKAHLLVFVDLW